MAVCPFHKDKNPSMKIDRRYYCFGCGEKGDAIDFVAKFYGIGKKKILWPVRLKYDKISVKARE